MREYINIYVDVDKVLDPAEHWARAEIETIQLQALRRQLGRMRTAAVEPHGNRHSAGFRRQLAGFEAADLQSLDDLRQLPVTTKEEHREALDREPPLGDMLGVTPEQVTRLHFSSGTTGAPTPFAWTLDDLDRWAGLYARLAFSQGVRSDDIHQCLFSYHWFVGGLGATAGYSRLGATVIPAGSVDTERQIDTIFRYAVTSVSGTPSFLLHVADVAARLGRDLRGSAVRHLMVGGEPGGALPATRAVLEERWGARCHDGYGCLEFQPIAWECAAQAGSHLCEDFAYAEVLHPLSREPVADGQAGVLVLSHLDKQAHPLLRYWTGDIVVRESGPCECGRTHARLVGGVRGRADDMLVIRGVNVFPSAVEEILRRQPGVGSEFRIVLRPELRDPATGYLTGFCLQVERRPEAPTDLGQRLAALLHAELRVRATVEVLEAGDLPRDGQKARRVVDLS